MLEALGGADNIVSLDNCITRLRLSVKDMSLVNVQALKDNRARYRAKATPSAMTDIQKYFQRAINPLVSLRTTLR
ncbi:PTS transporter subunit EIIB [Escherichia coli]